LDSNKIRDVPAHTQASTQAYNKNFYSYTYIFLIAHHTTKYSSFPRRSQVLLLPTLDHQDFRLFPFSIPQTDSRLSRSTKRMDLPWGEETKSTCMRSTRSPPVITLEVHPRSVPYGPVVVCRRFSSLQKGKKLAATPLRWYPERDLATGNLGHNVAHRLSNPCLFRCFCFPQNSPTDP
jgi:hypothetical protein